MKRSAITVLLSFSSLLTLAQVERVPVPSKQADTIVNNPAGNKTGMKELMKDLDLSREQRIKLKEIRQSSKTKKDAIESNDQLSDSEKKTRLRALQKEQAKNVQAILTDEQREKFRRKRQEMNKENN